MAAGSHHTCALLAAGTLKCWGNNDFGQIGDGTKTTRPSPVTVKSAAGSSTALSGVRAVAAGEFHTCALLAAGTMKCWGLNSASSDPFGLWSSGGQLGDGTKTNRSTPVTVNGSHRHHCCLVQCHANRHGGLHTCALLVTGTMKCWGDNTTFGQIGDGTVSARLAPVSVRSATVSSPLSGIGAIVGGQWYKLAPRRRGPPSAGVRTPSAARRWHDYGAPRSRHRQGVIRQHDRPGRRDRAGQWGLWRAGRRRRSHLRSARDRHHEVLGRQRLWRRRNGTTTERHAPVTVINLP